LWPLAHTMSAHNTTQSDKAIRRTIRYDTIEEFNVDSKAEYTA